MKNMMIALLGIVAVGLLLDRLQRNRDSHTPIADIAEQRPARFSGPSTPPPCPPKRGYSVADLYRCWGTPGSRIDNDGMNGRTATLFWGTYPRDKSAYIVNDTVESISIGSGKLTPP